VTISLGTLGLIWRIVCLGAFLVVLVELAWAQKRDGEVLRRLRAVFAAMAFVICFPTIATIDTYTDLSPGFTAREFLEDWVWVGYATLASCLILFWLSLHRWSREDAKD